MSEALGSLKPDGTQATYSDDSWFTTEKVSFQPNSSNRFIGFYLYVRKYVVGLTSSLVAYEARQLALAPENTFKGEWQYTRGSFVTSAQPGLARFPQAGNPTGSGCRIAAAQSHDVRP